jgi:hypothetical protein
MSGAITFVMRVLVTNDESRAGQAFHPLGLSPIASFSRVNGEQNARLSP